MANTVKKRGDISVAYGGEGWSDKALKSEFRKKTSWVVLQGSYTSGGYSAVLSNLLHSDAFYADDLTVDSVRAVLENGFDKSAYEQLKNLLLVSESELAKVIRIPSRTIARRKVFKADESERILRVARVFHRTLEVMEDLERARNWFKNPKRALGEKAPFEYCDTDLGANEVLNLLGRIEHGVFS